MEDRLAARRNQDRQAQDHLCAQVLAHLENFQLHECGTKHHLAEVQGVPSASVDGDQKRLQIDENHGSVAQVRTDPAQNFLRPYSGLNQLGAWSSVGVRADVRNMSECSKSCECPCHIRRRLNTPRLLDGFLGTLFVGYSGSPLLSQKCDRVSCQGRKSSATSLVYMFPRWFVMSRMIQMKAQVTAMYGPELSLRFNRVINGKALVFHYATTGDVGKMKQLFEQGRASPSDVRYDSGWTPFHVSLINEINLMSDKESWLRKST